MSDYRGVTSLVTGGAGFIGSHLCESLIEAGSEVIVVDDLSSGKISNIPREVSFIEGSISDSSVIERAMAEAEIVFHLAAISSVMKCEDNPKLNREVNFEATRQLSNLCSSRDNVRSLIFASSAAVYGDPIEVPINENHRIAPMSNYGMAKYDSEQVVKECGGGSGLSTCCLRFFNIYGERQDASSPYSGVISKFIRRINSQAPIEIFGKGDQTRDFVHVSDAVRACMMIGSSLLNNEVESPCHNSSLNVSTGRGVCINDVAELIISFSGSESQVLNLLARENEIMHSVGDCSAISNMVSWRSLKSLEEGLESLCSH